MKSFLNSKYDALEEYTPGEQPKDTVYTKLNTNESPYKPGPKTIAALTDTALIEKLRLYSDPDSVQLKKAIAGRYGLTAKNVFVSNGSDDILNFAFMGFSEDGVIFPNPSYGFYEVFAQLHGCDYEKIPVKADFSIDANDYKNVGKMVVIANPNAPTGRVITLDEIAEICDSNKDHVVLIDEAYVDFGAESCVKLIEEHENLLVCQTFSKSRSLAGARLGYALASEKVINDLEKIKYSTNPYNVNSMSAAAGIAAISEDDYYVANAKKIQETRAWTVSELEKLGFEVVPSLANFVFAKSEKVDGEVLYKELKARKILIRHFDNANISKYNRITIGTPDEMKILIDNIKEIIDEK